MVPAELPPAVRRPSLVRRLGRACEATFLAYEATPPLNDGSRLAVAAAVLAATHDPMASAIAFGGMTFGVEAGGAIASADLMDTPTGQRFASRTNTMLEKVKLSGLARSVIADVAIAMTLGTGWMNFNRQAADPKRTRSQNIRYGVGMAAGTSTVVGTAAYGVTSGIIDHSAPAIAGGAIGLAVIAKGADVVKGVVSKRNREVPAESYVYDEERFDKLEADLTNHIREADLASERVVTVIVPWDSPYAGIGHMSETNAYKGYDNHAAMQPYEKRSFWIYTVDTETGVVEHVKRIVKPMSKKERTRTGLTGIEIVDDRLTSANPNERASLDDIIKAHGIRSLDNVMNVTSNHVTGRGVDVTSLESGMNTLRSYKTTFFMAKHDTDGKAEGLFAYLNTPAIRSLGRLGVEHQTLLNGEYHLPDPTNPGQYDEHYTAVYFPDTPANTDAFYKQFIYEPAEGETPDRKLAMRAMLSGFIANESVPVLKLTHDKGGSVSLARLT